MNIVIFVLLTNSTICFLLQCIQIHLYYFITLTLSLDILYALDYFSYEMSLRLFKQLVISK